MARLTLPLQGFCRGAEALGHGPIRPVAGSLAIPKEWPSRRVFLAWMLVGVTPTQRESTLWTTHGTGFTRGPSPRNPLPIVHVKVLPERSTTADALSKGVRMNALKRVNADRFAVARLKHLDFAAYLRMCRF